MVQGNKYALWNRERTLRKKKNCERDRAVTRKRGLVGMDNLQRIYERFEDINDFAGNKERKHYGREYLQKFEEIGLDDNLMDLINAFQSDSTEAAYLDGMRFGMRFFMECVMNG